MVSAAPKLSILVVVYRMSRQAENTIRSLCAPYQRNVAEAAWEVVVVENDSDDVLGEERACAVANNVRYFFRTEPGQSPAPAVNFGRSKCRAGTLGIIIDGARMVTPRTVEYTLLGTRLDENALVVVPGYHLGDQPQHEATAHTAESERALLEKIQWLENGYRLFDISCWSGANASGFFHPFMECNCLFCPTASFDEIGGANEGFDLPGGGSLNLYLYRRLALLPQHRLVVLPGEGSFHQFHGGVTTAPADDLEDVLATHREQLARLLGHQYQAVRREPLLLGAVTSHALGFLKRSSERGLARFKRFAGENRVAWSDDATPTE